MRLIANKAATPRLLSTAAEDAAPHREPETISSAKLQGGGLFGGNGLAIFVGLGAAAALVCGLGSFAVNHVSSWGGELPKKSFVSVSPGPQSAPNPSPIIVQLTPELFHVTAIALGHPRLAVINGQQVGEGDVLTVHTPSANVAVQVRVAKIRDGVIELTDGTRTITVALSRPDLKPLRKSS